MLDGYPLSYETSKQVFFVIPEPPKKKPPTINEEGEEVPAEEEQIDEETLAEMLKPKFQSHIYPDSIILLRGEDEYIRNFSKSLPKEANTKWDTENLIRRLKKWHDANDLTLFKIANNDPNIGLPNPKQFVLPITRFF